MTQKKKKKCLCVDDKISGALPMYDEETKNALLHVKAEHNIAHWNINTNIHTQKL